MSDGSSVPSSALYGKTMYDDGRADEVDLPPCFVCGTPSTRAVADARMCLPHLHAAVRLRLDFRAASLPPAPPKPEVEQVVYYLRFGDRVKIGTTRNLRQRLAAIQHDELLVVEPGGYDVERERHREFAALKVGPRALSGHREWFRYEGALREHIDALIAS